MKIAITGGIAAGKSTVVRHLKEKFKGAQFYSVDEMVAQLYKENWWNDWLLDEFGTTDRQEISKRAFANKEVRLDLEAESAAHVGYQLGKLLANNSGLVFVEFPLLFESSMHRYFNKVVLVTAPKQVRVNRAIARGMAKEHVASVMLRQWPDDVKSVASDHIVDTTNEHHLTSLVSYISGLI